MTPPETPRPKADAQPAGGNPAVSSCPGAAAGPAAAPVPAPVPASVPAPIPVSILARRADFLRAARARRQGAGGFLLQARARAVDEAVPGIRVGFTCSKKIGNAVTRNRAKRRLRAVARAVLPQLGRAGWDYVLVGRPGATVERPFAQMVADLEAALARVHGETAGKAATTPAGEGRG